MSVTKRINSKTLMAGTALVMGLMTAPAIVNAADTVTYIKYDSNSDTYLEKKEFIDYSYDLVDYNNDGKVDATEWTTYKTTWYEPIKVKMTVEPDFVYYDKDGDGFIDSTEYVATYDQALFKGWDKDGNGFVDADEYDKVSVIYKDADTQQVYTW